MPGCQPCASADGVLIVSVRVLEYLCCLCGHHANVVIIRMSLWGFVQRRIPGTSDQVNWPVSFESSVFFSRFEERGFVGFESSVMFVAFLVDGTLYV
jgi:hypothetical protein